MPDVALPTEPPKIDERIARIEANVERIVADLANWSLHMAGRFAGTVYLVGSVLHTPEPRDIDIRIVVPDHEFGARYGMEMKPVDEPPTETRLGRTAKILWDDDLPPQRWVDDCAKIGAAVCIRLKHNADLKVWPDSYWREPWPKPVILAQPSSRWFIHNKYAPEFAQ